MLFDFLASVLGHLCDVNVHIIFCHIYLEEGLL
jgi:hypothetical protein